MTGVVCTPLRSEWAALHGHITAPLLRTGRGPSSWRNSFASPVLVAGVAGALDNSLHPGDLVVATETRAAAIGSPVRLAPLLYGAAKRRGLPVRRGPIVSDYRVAHGARRDALAVTGAIAVDTESAFLAAHAPHGKTAVLRTIVDTPTAPLLRPATMANGIHALRTLRAAAPIIDDWARATGDREIILAAPRSFCAGVERAIDIVEHALSKHGAPVYVRRQIVHNSHVVNGLQRRGAVFVGEVDEVPEGSVLVLAAHGVDPQVRVDAAERSLRVIDATCPLVAKVHTEVRRFADQGNTVLVIGHAEHEEVVGTRGEAPGQVIVIANVEEAEQVSVPDPRHVAYVTQTTLAVDEAEQIAAVLRKRFPLIIAPRTDDICYATTNRQHAVREVARDCDLMLVLGSENSSNSRRLAEVAEDCGVESHLVDDCGSVDLAWLHGKSRIGITAGASAPPALVEELIAALSGLGQVHVREQRVAEERIRFMMPREVS
ncbi:4-hydroxy-3-methylbut-2-enyl diphosphate reductase [Skermania sp. ID1734]|uniref:4-hydroxy-3-methylbut-2-enyl diphosphate reductase n=1 Tax=Skermania sp. ID1734 TaxID=2597516 RepID=UPI00117C6301|nr:4-hydroxy-3-methylbut-2-enyl diphosphate reductase [Skermania sp. ID1734]TSE00331.1 4-hydroxy-3-methylbut-2-enyl diphosphate reductase [Skermania sp. ID1734]